VTYTYGVISFLTCDRDKPIDQTQSKQKSAASHAVSTAVDKAVKIRPHESADIY